MSHQSPLEADINAMLLADYKEARAVLDDSLHARRACLLTAITDGQQPTQAIVEHRKAWRKALSLPSLTTILDPHSERAQQIIRNSTYEKPTTQGDPPPE